MKPEVMLLPFLILVSGCYNPVADKDIECNVDSECAIAGCSSQLCVGADTSSDIITTCEYKEEYSCLKLTGCGCVNNKCAWLENENYKGCLEEVRS